MAEVRHRIEAGGERLWRLGDFSELPTAAVAQAFSRLVREGRVERLSRGIYYRPRLTKLGRSRPGPEVFAPLVAERARLFPSGVAAANLLGLSTQTGRWPEVATTATSLPRWATGKGTVVHLRRPVAWDRLSVEDGALLDVLRHGGSTSDGSDAQTVRRTLALLEEDGRFGRLAGVASTEPPRVRAILGALGEALGVDERWLRVLRSSLNPLSRFEFGRYAGLASAARWQYRAGGAR